MPMNPHSFSKFKHAHVIAARSWEINFCGVNEDGPAMKRSTQVGQILDEIAQAAHKVSQVATEVASATQEQSHGIEQVNQSVSEVEKVTQANASTSEAAAFSSEELLAQAKQLNEMIAALAEIVSGTSNGHYQNGHAQWLHHAPTGQLPFRGDRNRVARSGSAHKVPLPVSVIPLDYEDLIYT